MNELHSFTASDGRFEFTVKGEFLQKCSNPHEFDTYDLLTKHKMHNFLHNPGGPALRRVKDDYREYWLNGVKATKEQGEKMEANFKFNNKLQDMVNTDEANTGT